MVNAIKEVIKGFLLKFWRYEKYKMKKEIYNSKNKLIDMRIKHWEKFMNDKDESIQKKSEGISLRRKHHNQNEILEKQKNDPDHKLAKEIVSNFENFEPILNIQEIEEMLKINGGYS